MANNDLIRFIPLYKSALKDDWDSANCIFQDDEEKLPAKLSYNCSWTPLHIAVGTNRSLRFVKELVERIVASGGLEKLRIPSSTNFNSLNIAAMAGNTTAARILVGKDPEMPQIVNAQGSTALNSAVWYAQKETLFYLLEVTKDVGEDGTSPFRGLPGANLITYTIIAGFYDVALYLVENDPNLVVEKDWNRKTALQTLAAKSSAFPSTSVLGFWLTYHLFMLVSSDHPFSLFHFFPYTIIKGMNF